MEDLQKAKAIKEQYEQQWLTHKEVVAVGIGKAGGQISIIISVSEHPEKVRKKIPAQANEVPITIQQTGKMNAR